MPKKKHRDARASVPPSPATNLCSVVVGDARVDTLAIGQERPEDLYRAFEKADYWKRYNPFVGLILRVRKSFMSFGQTIRSADGDKTKDEALIKWQSDPDIKPDLDAYLADVWRDALVYQNVISFWREGKNRPIVLTPGMHCQYRDKFGMEELAITHGITGDQLRLMDFSPALKAFLRSHTEIKLTKKGVVLPGGKTEDIGLFFEVAKDSKMGEGLCWPELASVFQACAQWESTEVGDSLLAMVGRIVYEQHKKGHEIRAGNNAGSPRHFWNATWAKAFEKAIKGQIGHVRMTTNFDHEVMFPRPDPKNFTGDKYAAVLQRLAVWGSPFYQMLDVRGGVNPFLLQMALYLAHDVRDFLAPHMVKVITEKWEPPAEIQMKWSDRCFRDPRTASEIIKNGLAAGPVSQRTYLDEASLDADVERANKAEEAALPESITHPIYDPAHGIPKQPGGHPAGQPNQK